VSAATLALGGLAVGTAAFLCLHTWLRWFARSWLEAFLVVFLVVYGSYFVAEAMFGVSGILAVVAIGFGMGRIGKFAVEPDSVRPNFPPLPSPRKQKKRRGLF